MERGERRFLVLLVSLIVHAELALCKHDSPLLWSKDENADYLAIVPRASAEQDEIPTAGDGIRRYHRCICLCRRTFRDVSFDCSVLCLRDIRHNRPVCSRLVLALLRAESALQTLPMVMRKLIWPWGKRNFTKSASRLRTQDQRRMRRSVTVSSGEPGAVTDSTRLDTSAQLCLRQWVFYVLVSVMCAMLTTLTLFLICYWREICQDARICCWGRRDDTTDTSRSRQVLPRALHKGTKGYTNHSVTSPKVNSNAPDGWGENTSEKDNYPPSSSPALLQMKPRQYGNTIGASSSPMPGNPGHQAAGERPSVLKTALTRLSSIHPSRMGGSLIGSNRNEAFPPPLSRPLRKDFAWRQPLAKSSKVMAGRSMSKAGQKLREQCQRRYQHGFSANPQGPGLFDSPDYFPARTWNQGKLHSLYNEDEDDEIHNSSGFDFDKASSFLATENLKKPNANASALSKVSQRLREQHLANLDAFADPPPIVERRRDPAQPAVSEEDHYEVMLPHLVLPTASGSEQSGGGESEADSSQHTAGLKMTPSKSHFTAAPNADDQCARRSTLTLDIAPPRDKDDSFGSHVTPSLSRTALNFSAAAMSTPFPENAVAGEQRSALGADLSTTATRPPSDILDIGEGELNLPFMDSLDSIPMRELNSSQLIESLASEHGVPNNSDAEVDVASGKASSVDTALEGHVIVENGSDEPNEFSTWPKVSDLHDCGFYEYLDSSGSGLYDVSEFEKIGDVGDDEWETLVAYNNLLGAYPFDEPTTAPSDTDLAPGKPEISSKVDTDDIIIPPDDIIIPPDAIIIPPDDIIIPPDDITKAADDSKTNGTANLKVDTKAVEDSENLNRRSKKSKTRKGLQAIQQPTTKLNPLSDLTNVQRV